MRENDWSFLIEADYKIKDTERDNRINLIDILTNQLGLTQKTLSNNTSLSMKTINLACSNAHKNDLNIYSDKTAIALISYAKRLLKERKTSLTKYEILIIKELEYVLKSAKHLTGELPPATTWMIEMLPEQNYAEEYLLSHDNVSGKIRVLTDDGHGILYFNISNVIKIYMTMKELKLRDNNPITKEEYRLFYVDKKGREYYQEGCFVKNIFTCFGYLYLYYKESAVIHLHIIEN